MAEQEKFEAWCVVEIMGRLRTAGRCSEQVIAGGALLRVDVPDKDDLKKFHTVFYGTSSIYSLHIVDETMARAVAAAHSQRPTYAYDVDTYLEKIKQRVAGQRSLDYRDDDEDRT